MVGSLLGQVKNPNLLSPLPPETIPNPCLSEPPNFPSYTQHFMGGKMGLDEGESFLILSNFKTKAVGIVEHNETWCLRKSLNKGIWDG